MNIIKINLLKFLSAIYFIFSISFINAQNNNNIISERIVDEFTSIEANGFVKIILKQSNEQSLKIDAPSEMQNKINTVVKNKTLHINAESANSDVNIFINCVNPEKITLNGVATLTTENIISANNFKIDLGSASKIKINIETSNLDISLSGAAKAELTGAANNMNLKMSGAAKLDAANFIVTNSIINMSGASTALINCSDKVSGKITGASLLNYINSPTIENIEKSGVATSNKKSSSDTTSIIIGKQKIIIVDNPKSDSTQEKDKKKKAKFNGHWGGVEIGINSYFNPNNNFSFPQHYDFLKLNQSKSVAFNINIWEQNFNLYKNHFGMLTGIGLKFNNYRFNDDIVITSDSAKIFGFTDNESNNIKSKLTVNYLTIPLIFEYQTNNKSKKNSFHIGGGVESSLRIGSHSKLVYKNNGKKKTKNSDGFHLNPFKFDAVARIGWGKINLFGNYSFTRLYLKDEGYELYPFTIGVVILGW